MDEYRIESEGIVMSETSEQRKAQDKYIADLRLQQMARAANKFSKQFSYDSFVHSVKRMIINR